MIQKLRIGIIITAVCFTVLFISGVWEYGVCYLIGFLTGALNFILLTVSVWFVTNTKYKKPVLIHRLFFIARYLLIVNILIRTVKPNAIVIILFFAGLLCVNFSVIVSSYRFRVNTGKEG